MEQCTVVQSLKSKESCKSLLELPVSKFRSATLRQEIESFNPDQSIESSWLPPSSWYTSALFLEFEQHSVLKENWLIAARCDQLTRTGQFVTGCASGEPYVIVRSETGQLRAFYNVCRHHAAEVASGEGCLEKFECPYHGWSYGLDGRLLSAPGLGGVKDFDKESFGLVPIQVEEWGPLVFLCRSDKPRSLSQDLAPLKEILDETNFETLTFVERREYILNCNWKVFVDNYLDGGYHVPYLHKGLASQLDLTTYETKIFDRFSIQSSAGTGGATGSDSASPGQDFAERLGKEAVYAWMYPNLMVNRYGSIMDTNWVIPITHDRTLVIIDFYFQNVDGPEARDFIEKSLAASEVVQQEDIRISESVQRGLGSSSYDRGRYSALKEMGEHHFHRLLAQDFGHLMISPDHTSSRS